MDSNSEAPSSECIGIDATLDDGDSTAFLASTMGPFTADSGSDDIDHINHQFDDMYFNKV